MSKILDQFHQAIQNQTTPILQYDLVKTVLDHYPLDKPLGQAALDVCTTMADKNPALRLLTVGRQEKESEAIAQNSAANYENNVEALVEFCAYGLDLTMLIQQSGLPKSAPNLRA